MILARAVVETLAAEDAGRIGSTSEATEGDIPGAELLATNLGRTFGEGIVDGGAAVVGRATDDTADPEGCCREGLEVKLLLVDVVVEGLLEEFGVTTEFGDDLSVGWAVSSEFGIHPWI